MMCSTCGGKGQIRKLTEVKIEPSKITGKQVRTLTYKFVKCKRCKGKGSIER